MSLIFEVPELWDGGYWYAVPVVPDPDEGPDSRTPGDIPSGWCAWYHDTEPRCIVRTPEPVVIPGATPLVDIAKGRGRIGGR